MNSNFEGWFLQNQDKSFRDFKFTFDKMSTSGSLFDLEKLINISKNYLSSLKASEVFEGLNIWTKEFDLEFNTIINKYKGYTTSILNIEREQKKPRKDFSCYSEIKNSIWYMFDEYFESFKEEYDWQNIKDIDLIKEITTDYFNNYYDINDSKDTWFEKLKELCERYGFASNMKDYKENPEKFKGNITDIATIIRVSITKCSNTPDLYEILRILGTDRAKERINLIK